MCICIQWGNRHAVTEQTMYKKFPLWEEIRWTQHGKNWAYYKFRCQESDCCFVRIQKLKKGWIFRHHRESTRANGVAGRLSRGKELEASKHALHRQSSASNCQGIAYISCMRQCCVPPRVFFGIHILEQWRFVLRYPDTAGWRVLVLLLFSLIQI